MVSRKHGLLVALLLYSTLGLAANCGGGDTRKGDINIGPGGGGSAGSGTNYIKLPAGLVMDGTNIYVNTAGKFLHALIECDACVASTHPEKEVYRGPACTACGMYYVPSFCASKNSPSLVDAAKL